MLACHLRNASGSVVSPQRVGRLKTERDELASGKHWLSYQLSSGRLPRSAHSQECHLASRADWANLSDRLLAEEGRSHEDREAEMKELNWQISRNTADDLEVRGPLNELLLEMERYSSLISQAQEQMSKNISQYNAETKLLEYVKNIEENMNLDSNSPLRDEGFSKENFDQHIMGYVATKAELLQMLALMAR
jgi:hypothetical protein